MQGPYKVITLCGSTRFKDQFIEAQKRLTLEGNIVISVGLFGHSGDYEVWSEGTKEMLDDMHKRKIEMADEIFVINVGGYIGSSTKSEIDFAKRTGKTVRYLEDPRGNRQTLLCRYIDQFTSLNTAKRMGKTAPHKAVMLVSIIDMIQVGLIKENVFYFTEVLQWDTYRTPSLSWGRKPQERHHLSNELFRVPAQPRWSCLQPYGQPVYRRQHHLQPYL